MSTSSDGKKWSAPQRIPIDAAASTVDHFIPGIGVDVTTSGKTAHLAIVYYYYPVSNCGSCKLYVGYTTSQNGGATWTSGKKLAGPMNPAWLPNSDNGYMVADYIGVSYMNGNPFGVFAVAQAPTGSTLHEAMYTTKTPLPVRADAPHFSAAADRAVRGAHSDHEMKFFYDDEGSRPMPKERWIKGDSSH